ncbi:MAG: hypothetical protein JSV80_06860 [Acidobacteriota bacterium]|nr:MAG: hypothetical protein JSV80_06860 [Acidobacteriota bacterium]
MEETPGKRFLEVRRRRRAVIREILLERLGPGEPVARSALLREVARRLEIDSAKRWLRAEVDRELRVLEDHGQIVYAGPEVYLTTPMEGQR